MLAANQPSRLYEVCTHKCERRDTHARLTLKWCQMNFKSSYPPHNHPPTHPHTPTHTHTHTHEFPGSETLQEHKKCASHLFLKETTKLFGEAINIQTMICECKALQFLFLKFAIPPLYVKKKAMQSQLHAWTGHEGSRRMRLPDNHENRYMKVQRLSVLRTGRLYPPRKYSWYSFSVTG